MPKIYLISPSKIDCITTFISQLEEIFLLPDKPVIFQLRLKNIPHFLEEAILKIEPLCKKHGVEFILNDDIPLALKHNIGVHVGEGALVEDIINFKKQSNKTIGVSCYNNVERALDFAPYASYVSFGAMFSTKTKQNAGHCEAGVIKQFRKVRNTPVSIIGGITHANLCQIAEILPLVNYICVVSCIWENS
jgi:thiamine-phosphate pyrophosphorylase